MNKEHFPWKTAIIAGVSVVVAGLAFFAFLSTKKDARKSIQEAVNVVERAVEKAPEIAQKFLTGSITHTFRESITSIEGNGGDILEVATLRADETFRREDEKRIGWGVSLGVTTAEIRAPVTFRYHIRLSDDWHLASQSNVCIVLAPPLRPSLPPAIHTDGMSKMSDNGWARFDKHDLMATLEKDMTPILEERAADPEKLALVREKARTSVASYVRDWLLREKHWSENRFSSIIVFFRGRNRRHLPATTCQRRRASDPYSSQEFPALIRIGARFQKREAA